jgi:hypothetical protein
MIPKQKQKKLRVWYGLRKLTKKAVRKPSIIVVFENSFSVKNHEKIIQKMNVLHTRYQTKEEDESGRGGNRMFTSFEMFFLDDKKFKKSPLKAIEFNYECDSNHVSKIEREEIKTKLLKEIYHFYGIKEPRPPQLEIQF